MENLKVMILDDEYIILDGLCSFPWESFGCEVTATARNGAEGLEKLAETEPDIILTDIKMPKIDGLVFAEGARELYPQVTIIFLTGYDSFEFAQKAIRTGVKDYLLKPVDFDKMKEVIGCITAEIRDKKKTSRYFESLQKYVDQSKPLLRARFTSNLLHGKISGKKEMEAQEATLGLKLEQYLVVVGKKAKDGLHMEQKDAWIEEFAYINICEEIFGQYGIEALSDYNMANLEYDFILPGPAGAEEALFMEKVYKACESIQNEVKKYCHVNMSFGLSNVSYDKFSINREYRHAQEACRQCIYLGDDIILKYQDIEQSEPYHFEVTSGERDHLLMTLFLGNSTEVESELRELLENKNADLMDIKFAAMEILMNCMKFPYSCAVESDVISDKWDVSVLWDSIGKIGECKDVSEVKECILSNFSRLIKFNTNSADEKNKKLVQGIIAYIEENYAKDLSMDDLTERFRISKTYISRLLKLYTGKSFLENLTDIRFKQVEKLLLENKYKQYEIAEMVGYKDFSYYIKVFKKRYGITPNEYKKRL